MEEWRACLDLFLIPVAFTLYLGYHFLLLYITQAFPERTYFGSKIRQLRIYLDFILWMDVRDRGAFVVEISSNVTLANTYGSYSAALIFFIGGLLKAKRAVVDGDGGAVTGTVKCGVVLVFALAAFLCFKVGGKTLGDASFLVIVPRGRVQSSYIEKVVVKGFIFCEAGNRLFYFSLALVAWFLGPIPMLAASLMLLIGLFMKDKHTIPLEEPWPHRELIPI